MTRYLFIIISCILLGLTLAEPALAEDVILTNPLGSANLPTIIGRVIRVALGISGSLALLMFIYGGFVWMTSGGSKEKIEKGRKTLVWAVIGLAVIFFAYVAVELVITALAYGE
jgi:hypothetical protein